MSKKSFRPKRANSPRYPKLSELAPPALLRWGLAAMGGLVLGDGACSKADERRLAGEAVPARFERQPRDGGRDARPGPTGNADGGVVHIITGPRPAGGLTPVGVRNKDKAADEAAIGENAGGLGGLRLSGTGTAARIDRKAAKHPSKSRR